MTGTAARVTSRCRSRTACPVGGLGSSGAALDCRPTRCSRRPTSRPSVHSIDTRLIDWDPMEERNAVSALSDIPERERAAVILNVVLDRTLLETGQALGVSRERARQLREHGLRLLLKDLYVGRTGSPWPPKPPAPHIGPRVDRLDRAMSICGEFDMIDRSRGVHASAIPFACWVHGENYCRWHFLLPRIGQTLCGRFTPRPLRRDAQGTAWLVRRPPEEGDCKGCAYRFWQRSYAVIDQSTE